MNFEQILEHCGNFSSYQFLLISLFGIVNFISSMHYFTQTVITFTSPHICVDNLTSSEIAEFYAGKTKSNCSHGDSCEKWIYNYEKGYESVTTELNWICNDAFKLAVGQSFFFVGSIIGTIMSGLICDKFGRIPAFLIVAISGGLGDFLTSFTSTILFFSTTRFLSGLSFDSTYDVMFIIVFECLNDKNRSFGVNIVAVFYTIGLVSTPWIAIWVGNWRGFLWAASLPTLVVLVFPFLISESTQWYISKNRIKDAIKSLKYVAKINRRKVPESIFEDFEKFYSDKNETQINPKDQDSFFKLFKRPRTRLIIVILLLKSMFVTLSYDIVARSVEGYGISPFYLFSLSSSLYLPAGYSVIFLHNRFGRRGTTCISLAFGFVFSAITAVFVDLLGSENNVVVLLLFICICRFISVLVYTSDTQFTADLVPISIRGLTLSSVHVVGNGFSFFCSYIIYFGLYVYGPIPMIINSILMLLSFFLCLRLPETLKKTLPETITDLEEFGKDDNLYKSPLFSFKKP